MSFRLGRDFEARYDENHAATPSLRYASDSDNSNVRSARLRSHIATIPFELTCALWYYILDIYRPASIPWRLRTFRQRRTDSSRVVRRIEGGKRSHHTPLTNRRCYASEILYLSRILPLAIGFSRPSLPFKSQDRRGRLPLLSSTGLVAGRLSYS